MHVQGVRHDNHDGSHNTSDVDSHSDVLGVIESLDFDLPYREGENEGNDLQNHLVAIENPDSDGATPAVTHIHKIVCDLLQILQ